MKAIKTRISLLLIGLVYIVSVYSYKPYKVFYDQDGGDSFGYYVYLPSLFIHHDLHDLYKTMAAKYSHTSPGRQPSGSYQNKYFAGTAFMQAPFFLMAHAAAGPLHQPADGFSMVYMIAIIASCIFWGWIGLVIVSWILSSYFSDGVSAIVVLCIGLGTNLYYLIAGQPPFSHAYLFFWYAVLIYFTIKYHSSLRPGLILIIGFCCGMIIATRANEMYCVLIPVLWGISSRASMREKILLFKNGNLYVLGAGFLMFICLVPQFLYWKISVGKFIYYSYTDEKFNFLHPHLIDGLFSFGNGWLPYSPIMLLALFGIFLAFRFRHPARFPLLVFTVVHIYVIYSWWCWFYMGSYGSRPMTEAYPLLSIPLGLAIDSLMRSWPRRVILLVIATLCIFEVQMQTYQMTHDIFNSELSNWRFNLITFGKTVFTYEESIVIDTKEFQPEHPVLVRALLSDSAVQKLAGINDPEAHSGAHEACLPKDSLCMLYHATMREIGLHPGQWIKASVMCMAKDYTYNNWHKSPLVIMYTRRGHKTSKWNTVALQNKIDNPEHKLWHFTINKWGRVYFYSSVPDDMQLDDELRVYVEHVNGPDICIDDPEVEIYEGK
ncbi:MAG: hypothetical protein JST90_16985 [Bacteroidetes bacterium]|nr:hypothetical protein [Bacteroidota bacterium]